MTKKILSLVSCAALLANNTWWLDGAKAASEPYQKTFIVTAYYSPLEGQNYYVTGSLAGDKRLNGNGTNGADGTPVYPGMIAAPGTYAFGTRISCPGYIDGEIHDRGGAIVKAGVRNNPHDRLDFWAGHGDEALKTALYWGKRTLNCTVYPPNHSPAPQYVTLPTGKLTDFAKTFLKKPQTASVATYSGEVSTRYKTILENLGYDPEDKASRIAFQIRHKIISSETDPSAGNIGPNTKTKLEQIAIEMADRLPVEGLKEGNVSADVRVLQQILADLGYLSESPTAIFGEKTKEALIKFQLEKKVIESKDHPAAGYVGPGTITELKKMAGSKYSINSEDQTFIAKLKAEVERAEAIALANELAQTIPGEGSEQEDPKDELYQLLESLGQEWVKEHTPVEDEINASKKAEIQLAAAKTKPNDNLSEIKEILSPIFNPFDHSLRLGSKHAEVKKMQTVLKENGYFEGELITDYFGPQTKKAVAQFQVEYGIVPSLTSSEAGIVGPKTIKALNAFYYQNEFSLPKEITSKIRAPAIHPSDLNKATQHASTEKGAKS